VAVWKVETTSAGEYAPAGWGKEPDLGDNTRTVEIFPFSEEFARKGYGSMARGERDGRRSRRTPTAVVMVSRPQVFARTQEAAREADARSPPTACVRRPLADAAPAGHL